eukprot:g1373.t1
MADDEAGMKNTREDRIRQRRQRIEQRQSSRNVGGSRKNRGDGMGAGNDTLSLGKQQTQTSLAHIDRVKARSIEHVTTVRVEADNIENRRRIVEEDKRHERLRRLQEEAIKSGKQNAAVEMRWQELMNYNMPNDLRDELAKQTDMCKNIKDSKQGLIEEFKQELKSKDEDYVLALKKQGEDITQLISRMRKQYKDLQGEYHAELNQIEDAFMRERDELLLNNKNEIDGLFDKRRQMEIHYMEAKQDREEKFAEEIDALRVRDAEDYSKLKIKLETDIQTLEQQLEEMRATYQLNTEKLEYNYRVLTERDMENSATLSTQKRRLARLKEALANLVQKYTQSDTKHKQLNQELTDEYRRITKQYKDLQNKFRHFEVADNDKFQQVWEMHTDEASKLVEKVLQADEIIHTQLLGMRWLPPSGDVFAQNKARQEAAATTAAADGGDGAQKTEKEASSQRVDQAKVKIMLRLLCDEAGFLIDQATHDKIKSMGTKEGLVTKADSILD